MRAMQSIQRAPSKTTESWAAQGAHKQQGSANGSCWKPAAAQGRADPQGGEQGNTGKPDCFEALQCLFQKHRGSASAQVPVELREEMGEQSQIQTMPFCVLAWRNQSIIHSLLGVCCIH